MKKTIFLFVLFFPLATYLLSLADEGKALIWLMLDTIYYYPVYLLASPLFKEVEMGILIPSLAGRILTFLVYAALMLVISKLVRRVRMNPKSPS